MVKKVGIISSLYNNINYGAILQSYALVSAIKSLGYDAHQILYSPALYSKKATRRFSYARVRKGFSLIREMGIRKLMRNLHHTNVVKRVQRRYNADISVSKKFADKFVSEFIPVTEPLTDNSVETIRNSFDIFVCGSDQIWNPNWFSEGYFLSFAGDSKLKIAYAPSLGVTQLTSIQIAKLRPLINRLDAISVRELGSVSMLAEVTDKPVTFVLDPALLLTSSEWDNIATRSNIAQEKPYIYYYIHGGLEDNINLSNEIFKDYNIPVISTPSLAIMYGSQCFNKSHAINRFDIGPGEFINLIKYAEAVVTESFHATVFSILYRKQFYVLLRDHGDGTSSMNSRLINLLRMVHLEDRIISDMKSYYAAKNKQIDYDSVHQILTVERARSYAYLKNNLNLAPNGDSGK